MEVDPILLLAAILKHCKWLTVCPSTGMPLHPVSWRVQAPPGSFGPPLRWWTSQGRRTARLPASGSLCWSALFTETCWMTWRTYRAPSAMILWAHWTSQTSRAPSRARREPSHWVSHHNLSPLPWKIVWRSKCVWGVINRSWLQLVHQIFFSFDSGHFFAI